MRNLAVIPFIFVILAACGGKQSIVPAPVPEAGSPVVAACDGGAAKSCLIAADEAEKAGDRGLAASRYRRACDLGEVSGCALAGGVRAEDGDIEGAAGDFEAGCAGGDGTSCFGAGLLALGIYSGEPDHARAASAFERGCTAGLADACGELANLLAAGQGVALDLERASQLRVASCEQGHAPSCTRLGLEAWRGQSDQVKARGLFESACMTAAPDPDGCGWLGWMFWEGLGGDKDEAQGVALLESSCEVGSASGCALRAMVHSRVGEDDLAQQALRRACELDPAECERMQTNFK